jgi:nucleoside-diphosphate-sugar epimerase
MKKRVLVLGGSYFIGRVFSIMADKTQRFDLTVINRGRFPLKRPSIREYVFDRHNENIRSVLEDDAPYDVLVDFCAYEPGDSADILTLLKGRIKQYIEISSCAVFASSREPRTEDSPHLAAFPNNPVEEYAYKKMLLEKEIKSACSTLSLPYTIFRPCFVFGPFNYAPRESFYFDLMLSGEAIPHPVDAGTEFSFVYVRDIARAIMAAAENPQAYNRSYNLAGPERVSYGIFLEALRLLVNGQVLPVWTVTKNEVYEKNISLPFPLEQNELFEGLRVQKELGLSYTGFVEALKETFTVYKEARR